MKEFQDYNILWDQIEVSPSVQIKVGIKRKNYPLTRQFTSKKNQIYFVNQFIELKGTWNNLPGFGSLLSLELTNIFR